MKTPSRGRLLAARVLNGLALLLVAVFGALAAGGTLLVALFSRSGSRTEVEAMGAPLLAVVVVAGGLCIAGFILAGNARLQVASFVTPALALAVLALPFVWLKGAQHESANREADELAALNRPLDDFAALGKTCVPTPDDLSMRGDCPERYLCALDDGARRCRSSCTFDRHCPPSAKCTAGLCR